MNRIAGRAGITMLIVFLLLVGFVFFLAEYFMEADEWVIFPGSPHVYNGTNIGCGIATDNEGVLLLDLNAERTYAESEILRKSTVHWVGDRYGYINAPALPNYASELAGYNILTGVYSYGQGGGVAQMTLSAQVQDIALEAMGNYKGTVAVYNYKTGQLLCAVTTPTYDPDNVPELEDDETGALEGMYVNRFTQSVYIPGSIFKLVTLAAALETLPDAQEQTFKCEGSLLVGADKITCEARHGTQSLQEAFGNSCNCAFAQIAMQLGGQTLERYAEQFGVTKAVSFDGITTAEGNFEAANTSDVNVAWSGIGQYKDQINPCAFLKFVGAVAAGGKGVEPYLVERITVDGSVTYKAKTQQEDRIMSDATASVLRDYMRSNVEHVYGDEKFPDLTVCAKTGTGEVGGGKKPNAMLAGFVEDEQYPYAFIVAVEDAGYGGQVCIPIISKVLQGCKDAF